MDRNNVIRPAIDVFLASLSARRAWIEIITPIKTVTGCVVALRKESVDRNDPDGILVFCGPQSLSARRAWIEIIPSDNRK